MGHTVNIHEEHGHATNTNFLQSLQENAITAFGPRLYKYLFKYLIDMSFPTETFKLEISTFLHVSTLPRLPNAIVRVPPQK